MYTIGGVAYSTELYHHGILGMRWGDKNGPPYPLGSGDHSASEKKAGYKKSLGGGRNEELYDRKEKKVSKNRYDRMASRYEKRAEKLEKQGQNSKANNARKAAEKMKQTADKEREKQEAKKNEPKKTYREKLVDRYKEYGLSEKEAQEAADRKIAIEKGVVVGAVTVAALAGAWYVNREIGRNITGKIIKKGTIMQTLSPFDNRIQNMVDSGEHFFTTFTKKDKLTYLGDFGMDKFINRAKATQDMKIASRNQSIEVFKDAFKKANKDQIKEISDAVTNGGFRRTSTPLGAKIRILGALEEGNLEYLSKKDLGLLYDSVNYKLADQEDALLSFRPQLYTEFVNKGFGGLMDTNDQRYSCLVGDFPSIIIDKTKFDVLPSTKATTGQKSAALGWQFVRGAASNKVGLAVMGAEFGMIASNTYDRNRMRQAYLGMTESEAKAKIKSNAAKAYKNYKGTKDYQRLIKEYINEENKWYDKHKDKT